MDRTYSSLKDKGTSVPLLYYVHLWPSVVDRHPIEVGNSAMELLAKQMQRQQTGCRQPEKVTRVEYLSTLVLRNSSCKPR